MKTYRLTGYALVPVEVEMEVDAEDEQTAIQIGQAHFKSDPSAYVVSNSADECSACDWEPSATELPR